MRKIYKQNYSKKKAISENNTASWEQYKQARKETNNAVSNQPNVSVFCIT